MKPGITLSNTMTAVAGYLLAASHVGFEWTRFVAVIAGVALIIASACVVNNMIDRDLDAKMKRTRGRELAAGKISMRAAAAYAAVLGAVGFWALNEWTPWPTAGLGVLAFVWYVVVYGIAKRTTPLSTIVGGVCGALPPVAGYVAATGQIDTVAWILFGLMMVWQLPHFYAISIFRRDDYAAVSLPVWSVFFGTDSTKAQIYFWALIFLLLTPLLTVVGATGWVYFVVMLGVGLYWVWQAAQYYDVEESVRWSKRMFGSSLLVLLVMSAAIALGGYLP
jgi:heme o synthase